MQALEQRIASNDLPPGAKNAVGELFILHDRQHGMFEIMRDAVGRLAPPQDPAERGNWESCVMCALRSGFHIPSPSLLLYFCLVFPLRRGHGRSKYSLFHFPSSTTLPV
jgi:hypothetical protein